MRLQPLLDCIQKLKNKATTNSEPISMIRGGNDAFKPSVPADYSTASTVLLSEGSVVDNGDDKKLIISIECSSLFTSPREPRVCMWNRIVLVESGLGTVSRVSSHWKL